MKQNEHIERLSFPLFMPSVKMSLTLILVFLTFLAHKKYNSLNGLGVQEAVWVVWVDLL